MQPWANKLYILFQERVLNKNNLKGCFATSYKDDCVSNLFFHGVYNYEGMDLKSEMGLELSVNICIRNIVCKGRAVLMEHELSTPHVFVINYVIFKAADL